MSVGLEVPPLRVNVSPVVASLSGCVSVQDSNDVIDYLVSVGYPDSVGWQHF